MPYVPAGTTKDGKTYGGYAVSLTECSLCGNLYAAGAENEHSTTPTHAAAKAAQQG